MENNIWTRRSNTGKLSLTTSSTAANGSTAEVSGRNGSISKRQNDGSKTASTPGGGLVSPTNGASKAFGLGSGAFASFGSAKPQKTSANPFDVAMGSAAPGSAKETFNKIPAQTSGESSASDARLSSATAAVHPLKDIWTFWYRPPISKAHGFIEYEDTLHGIAKVRTVEDFWDVYSFLKRPSSLPLVSDYHFFKKDIRPIWEDDVNRRGGKWVVRIKKGIADRYWEDLVLALIGDQFGDASEEVCGVVLSIRNGEDILSIWTRTDGGRVLKIREIMKHVLNFPANTRLEFKSHDSSIQQKTAIDEQRREKQHQSQTERRTAGGAAIRQMNE